MIKIGVEFNLIIKVLDDKYGDWMFGVFIVVNDNIFGGILFVDCYFFLNNSCKYGNILKEEYVLGDWNFGVICYKRFKKKKCCCFFLDMCILYVYCICWINFDVLVCFCFLF